MIENNNIRINYLHDGCYEASFIIKKLGYEKGLYKAELGFTDATDYERTILFLVQQYENASHFKKEKVGKG